MATSSGPAAPHHVPVYSSTAATPIIALLLSLGAAAHARPAGQLGHRSCPRGFRLRARAVRDGGRGRVDDRCATRGTGSPTTTTWPTRTSACASSSTGRRPTRSRPALSNASYQDLLRLNNLPALTDYPTLVAQVVGNRRRNFDQIDRDRPRLATTASRSAWRSPRRGGLVGKITAPVLPDRAFVMLVTDTRYAVEAQVLGVAPTPEDPSLRTPASTTRSPTTTSPPRRPHRPRCRRPPRCRKRYPSPSGALPARSPTRGRRARPSHPAPPTPPSSTTTTTTTLPPIARDTGIVEGAGRGNPPEMRLVKEDLVRRQVPTSAMR